MCQEVFEIICGMDIEDIELQIALQCAPLITGIKMSNLLKLPASQEEDIHAIFHKTGIDHFRLWGNEKNVVYLLYNQSRMEKYLCGTPAAEFLCECGYTDKSFEYSLRELRRRCKVYAVDKGLFPHEMGLFLGYPVDDVRGFIENKGENYLYCGYWKVYGRVEQKKILFMRYEEAKEKLVRMLSEGIGMRRILEVCSEGY